MEQQRVILSQHLQQSLEQAMSYCPHDRLFILTDETTKRCCLPVVSDFACLKGAYTISIPATDVHKNLESLSHVWSELQQGGATRHSLLINIGGGMVTDLGGFAASTFKRGIQYINIPTTLLSMVDASVGGKTGINFGGLKNEIGVFNNASSVILDTIFLKTLDRENLLSGYAEMLKHGLISSEAMWAELMAFPVEGLDRADIPENPDILEGLEGPENPALLRREQGPRQEKLAELGRLLADSVAVKQRIVTEDPTEKGLRKALNLGHTAGHAFESLALERQPILHGYAVAYGLIVELYLAVIKTGFPTDRMRQTVQYIKEHYGRMAITCDDYPKLLQLMHHDKKNEGNSINFTLLGGIGDIRINQTASEAEIKEALDFYREN